MADGVGELQFDGAGETGGDDIFRDPPAHVSRGAIHLRRILAREGATAMTSPATVSIHDDLTTGQTGVAFRATDDKATRRVDQEFGVFQQPGGEDLADHIGR